jgi:hypothetical protein
MNGNFKLKRFSILLTLFLILISSQDTWAFFGIGEETFSWKEEVVLLSGEVLLVERTLTRGPDEWWRKGWGNISYQTLSFSRKSLKYEWSAHGNDWPWGAVPLVLEIINDAPVIIMPVSHWKPCSRYDFPQEGLVALRFNDNQWARMSFIDLPQNLKMNLLHSSRGVHSSPRYDTDRIEAKAKSIIERDNAKDVPRQGASFSEIIRFYATGSDSCATMHPLPNPTLDALNQKITDAVLNAKVLEASLESSSNSPTNISPEEFRNTHGEWTGHGYLPQCCNDFIKGIKPILQYREGGGRSLVGHTIVLHNGNDIPLQKPNIEGVHTMLGGLDLVICKNVTIYAIEQYLKDQIIVFRFSNSGSLIDAIRISLPNVAHFFPDGTMPTIWEGFAEKDQLVIVLARYSSSNTSDHSGILEQQVRYKINLPENY